MLSDLGFDTDLKCNAAVLLLERVGKLVELKTIKKTGFIKNHLKNIL